jgi:hypothetical protein
MKHLNVSQQVTTGGIGMGEVMSYKDKFSYGCFFCALWYSSAFKCT